MGYGTRYLFANLGSVTFVIIFLIVLHTVLAPQRAVRPEMRGSRQRAECPSIRRIDCARVGKPAKDYMVHWIWDAELEKVFPCPPMVRRSC